MPAAFPLAWPEKFPRSPKREAGSFKTTLPKALANVQKSLEMFARDSKMKLEGLVISSNVTLGASKPSDTGVSVWFTWGGMQVTIPVDRYTSVEANLQAIHHIVEARRVELRHGTLALVRATFSGFLALEHEQTRPWWEVLEVHQDAKQVCIEAAYKRLRGVRHPDRSTGSPEAFHELVRAYEQATA